MTSSNLADFDFLQLLLLLAGGKRTGVLRVSRGDDLFQCWLEQGRVRAIQLTSGEQELGGLAALVSMLRSPSGRFQFDEGLLHPDPPTDSPLDPLAYAALSALPEMELPFTTAARIPDPERLDLFDWTLQEKQIVEKIRAQVPLGELAHDPLARQVAARLARLGILRPRKLRTARLLVTVTHDVSGVVLVDDMIVNRWKNDLVRLPQYVGVRDEGGKSYRFPLRGHPDLGALICIPPDVLTKTRLRGGDSVLVKPL
ncbi:MAG: DUF4388 domain-containing protein [Deinococcus sp.]|uniref:DUF4388 domain-containing protein n=1 Tax=Deinococcus sp. VB142 TaxID=3112952 RepID=A0AAU6Q1I3_9DEIO|nr:DUF4388 domain-containing protein [Deinococcus sp.]MDO4245989.1 DUF4388 domain-containing protein [Deinococcus sp.]